jgi:carbonic anhydrase/acetyltransferase-like protein (isoleucine patch superfamily)
MIWALDGLVPDIHPTAWIAPDANIIGKVRIGPGASVWFGATLRGDTEWIEVGEGSNVQEACVLHTDSGFPLRIGRDCTIGHKAMLHGCTIGDGSLVGMGATVLNGAVIGGGSLVGACALVTEGKAMPGGSLIVGAPAKVVRPLTGPQVEGLLGSARHYQANAARFRAGLSAVA